MHNRESLLDIIGPSPHAHFYHVYENVNLNGNRVYCLLNLSCLDIWLKKIWKDLNITYKTKENS